MTQKPKILITGATGKTGSAAAKQLLEKGYPVRATVHRDDARSQRLRQLGAEVVVVDMYDPEQWMQAMRGIQRAYFLPIMRPYMIQSAVAFAVAAKESNLESVVHMSQWLSSPNHPALMTRQTWLVDQLFSQLFSKSSGIAHTIVNPGMFADNYLRMMDMASLLGLMPVLTGDSKSAPVSNEDIARVVVAVLENPEPHAGKTYRPTGPQLLSVPEMAKIMGQVLGHHVQPVKIPFWLFLKVARLQKVDPYQVLILRDYFEDHRQGAFEYEGGVNQVIEELTGSPAESFESTVRRYAAKPFAQKTISNRIKAIVDFMITPLYPRYCLEMYERDIESPQPAVARFVMSDEQWLTTHSSTSTRAHKNQNNVFPLSYLESSGFRA